MLLLLLACAPEPETDKASESEETTDTAESAAYCVPETERCNGVDDDCDGEIDEDTPRTRVAYRDADGDGYGNAEAPINVCGGTLGPGIPDGYVTDSGDCDDADSAIHPGVPERCATDRDEDCDGSPNGRDGDGCTLLYRDEDEDGVGTEESQCWCSAVAPFAAAEPGDCDDDDPHHAADCSADIDWVTDASHVTAARSSLTFGTSTCTTLMADHGDATGDGGTDLVLACTHERVLMAPADAAGVADLEATAVGSLTLGASEQYQGAADLTGDGVLDLLVTRQSWEYDPYGAESGDFIVSRVPGPWSPGRATAEADWTGGGVSWRYDGSAGVLGDIDGDGIADAAWSAGTWASGIAEYAPEGASTGTARSIATWNSISELLDGGDLDGDGLADIVAVDLGVIAVFGSPYDENYKEANAWVWGDSPSAAGDVDGDGYDDLFVHDSSGVHVLRSPIVSPGEPAADHAWATILADLPVTSAELDGDDGRELLVGQSDADRGGIENTGALFVLLAPTSGTIEPRSADRAWYGDAGDAVGRSLTPLPDLDGDGSDDVAVSGATGIWVLGEP